MAQGKDDLFLLGVVTGTHGLRGDLKIRPLTERSDSLPDAETIFLRRPGSADSVSHLPERVTIHKGGYLLRLQGFGDINAVQPLVGCEVLMRYGDLAPLDEDEFYWFELEGLEVIDRNRGELGVLEETFSTAAHDIWVVRGRFGEVLIPVVEEFIVEIDREARRLQVDLPAGLVPETSK